MRQPPFVTVAVLATVLAATTACGPGADGSAISRSGLEQRISEKYEPDDPKTTLTAACPGGLDAADDATQDCTVTTDDKEVGVRARVTDEDADDLGLETTPFLAPATVGEAIASSLEIQGYTGVESTCDGNLMGEVGDTVVCELSTLEGDTTVNVEVSSIDGLLINFTFKSA
jgi:hypothetical protein